MIQIIDKTILVMMLILVIKGIWRGLTKELISVVSYGIAFVTAMSQSENGTRFFETKFDFHPILGYLVSYSVVFFVVFLISKFFIKRIIKIINKEPPTGLIDSIGGAVFGFCLGMLFIGMFLNTFKPIPLFSSVLEEKHNSLFIPFAEKYSVPIVSKVMKNPTDQFGLDKLLAKGLGPDMVMPDMMKGLMEGNIGDMLSDPAKLLESAGIDGDTKGVMGSFQKMLSTEEQIKHSAGANTGYGKAISILGVDTSKKQLDTKSLLELLKKK